MCGEASYPQLIGNLSVLLASIIASATAIYGINSWRREIKGKRQIELAEDVLSNFYQAFVNGGRKVLQ